MEETGQDGLGTGTIEHTTQAQAILEPSDRPPPSPCFKAFTVGPASWSTGFHTNFKA